MSWTAKRTATLQRLWSDGYSGSQIAKQLGDTSRSAVIAKVYRLKLRSRKTTNPKAYAERQKPKNKTFRFGRGLGRVEPLRITTAIAQPEGRNVPLLGIPPGGCHWPTNNTDNPADHLFCGAPAVRGYSYCPAHLRRNYRPGK